MTSSSNSSDANGILKLIMNAANFAKVQETRIPLDINLIKQVAKTALNSGETGPKDLLVRVSIGFFNKNVHGELIPSLA